MDTGDHLFWILPLLRKFKARCVFLKILDIHVENVGPAVWSC